MNEQTSSLKLGVITPVPLDESSIRPSLSKIAQELIRRYRAFLLVVVVPTLLTAAYYFLIASDQYVSEAHFLVHSADRSNQAPAGLSMLMSRSGMGGGGGGSEAMSVGDYLASHDAVSALARNAQLVERFRRPEADWLSRLYSDAPEPEKLFKYYLRHVEVRYDNDTGITRLTVRAFRPVDSYAIINALLNLGEQRVNAMNRRSFDDAIRVTRAQLDEAEKDVEDIQVKLTRFRQTERDIDPLNSGAEQTRLVTGIETQLATARAQLASMGSMISTTSPQYRAMAARVHALAAQVSQQNQRLTGGNHAIAADIGDYEGLKIRQDLAAKRYEAAAASLQHAREDALKQQLFITRVVEPNMPVRSLYPDRWAILATVFVSLLVIYGLGWLIAAGVREHAA